MKTLRILLCLLLMLACAGCSPQKPAAPAAEPVVLTFMLPQTHFKDFLKDAIARYEAEQSDVRISVQVIPDNQWVNLIKTKAFTNEPPDIVRIDLAVMLQIGPERFVELGEGDAWLSRAIPSELEPKKIDGRIYGLPVASNSTVGIVYNKAIFEEYGLTVPRSMDEMRAVCERLREAGIIPLYASDKDSWTTQTWFTSGAPQVAPEGTWEGLSHNTIRWRDVDAFAMVLDDMASLRRDGFTNADYMMATYASAVEAMAEGKAAMYVSGHFFINDVLAKAPDMDLAMAPMVYSDQIAAIQAQGMLAIFEKSEHVEEARAFLNWFSQAENMDRFTAGWGYTPLFEDQTPDMPGWLSNIHDDYLRPGNYVLHVDSQLIGVDFVDFWGLQQELVGGSITAQEVLEKWDTAYAQQMRNRKMPGW